MAAVTAPAGRRRSTSRCCISSATRHGRTRRCWPRCARWCCRRSRSMGRSRRGSSTTRRFPSKGKHSVGVHASIAASSASRPTARWRCRCRLPIMHASLPVAYRLYLPQEWAEDRERRKKAGVPKEIAFKTKPEIALEQIRWACEAGLPRGVVLMDAGYGCNTRLRAGAALGSALRGRHSAEHLDVRRCGTGPRRKAKPLQQHGPSRRARPISVKELALGLPNAAWRTIEVAGGHGRAAVLALCARARSVAHRQSVRRSRPEEWLLIEWPKGEAEPTKYWLSTLPENITFRALVDMPSCAGASSATIRSSSRRSGSGTSRDADGAASITTPRCASRPTDS